jgi:hypothetical protein
MVRADILQHTQNCSLVAPYETPESPPCVKHLLNPETCAYVGGFLQCEGGPSTKTTDTPDQI